MNMQHHKLVSVTLCMMTLCSVFCGCAALPTAPPRNALMPNLLHRIGRGKQDPQQQAATPCNCESPVAPAAATGPLPHPRVGKLLQLPRYQVEQAAYTDYPPVIQDDTAYATAGPAHGGTELPQPQRTATEYALELKAENNELRAEQTEAAARLDQLESRVQLLTNEITAAKNEARDAQKKLQTVEIELQQWQQQTVAMYSAVKRSEQNVLDSMQRLTTALNQIITMQQQMPAPAPAAPAPAAPVTQPPPEQEPVAVRHPTTPRLLPTTPVMVNPVIPAAYQLEDE